MKEMYDQQELKKMLEFPARDYKDRVFRMIFKIRKQALELYNALNNTDYTNEDDLEITTLENAIYLGMKNDISFVLYNQLMLYEHQSTRNPNMPLRDLFYVACVFSRLTADKNLHSSTLIKLPEPKFLVFYNGKDSMPESEILTLSTAYEQPTDNPALELKVLVLNINPGYNEELKARSRTLYEYMVFVDTVRNYSKCMPFPEAMEIAIDECIRNGILEDFLIKNKAEVMKVGIFEYDEEKHLEMERNEAEARGEERGKALGEDRLIKLMTALLNAGKIDDLKKIADDKELRDKLYKEYGL